jgi:hypothetical protein
MFLKWFKKTFNLKKIEQLESENKELKEKLVEKQEHINKTNAYWKKRMFDLKTRK